MPMLSTKDAFEHASTMVKQGHYRSAYRATSPLYNKNPHFPPVVALHVSTLLHLNRVEEGITIARRALRHITHKPHRVAVLNTLAEGLTRQGNLEGAIRLFQEEIIRQPHEANLIAGLGHVLLVDGQKDEAITLVEEAGERGMRTLAIAAIFGRAVLRSDRINEGVEMIERLLEDIKNPPDGQLSKAMNALGHMYDRLKRYPEAMEAFTRSNDLMPSDFHDELVAKQVEMLKEAWTAEGFEGVPRPPEGMPRPVFILGMPRSGTTLTEQIIDAHPLGFGAGELGLISELFVQTAPERQNPFSISPGDYDPKKIAELASVYRQETRAMADNPDVQVITDKAPMNFGTWG